MFHQLEGDAENTTLLLEKKIGDVPHPDIVAGRSVRLFTKSRVGEGEFTDDLGLHCRRPVAENNYAVK